MTKRIFTLSATGRTGKHAVAFALAKGYEVVALVRDREKITVKPAGLTIITGLPTDLDDVRKALARLTNFKVIFEEHNAQERLVKASGTNWTIARPVVDHVERTDW